VFLWSLLLGGPGVAAYYSYRQAFFILLDNPELGAVACLRRSRHLMNGYRTELFILDLSFVGWRLIDFIVEIMATLRLFSIWLSPYVGVTRAGFYDALRIRDAALRATD
jgi:uncharacterized membrane protein